MARSKAFFGMRRGSTKSLTFSVYRGQQITKDRVESVRNPQSSGQMDQRLKLPLVANARAVLKELVNHSFEGVPYGDESLRTFSQENLRTGNLNIVEYVPKGGMDCGLANFLVSRGSIEPIVFKASTIDGIPTEISDQSQEAIMFGVTRSNLTLSGIATSDPISNYPDLLDYIATALGVDPQAQLTFLLLRPGYEYEYDQSSDKKGTAHYHRFVVSRLKLGEDLNDVNSQWGVIRFNVTAGGGNETPLTDIDISDGYVTLHIETYDNTAKSPGYIAAYIGGHNIDNLPADQKKLEAAAIITSLQTSDGNWRRSTQRLTLLKSVGHPTYDEALYSYLEKKPQSTKYLNSGTEGVGITGGKG